jgi:Spy/CpxP family protein refolding chaperone
MKDVMKIISLVAALAVVLALATTASAEQASQDGYLNQAGQVQGQVNSGGTGGGLPFTGFDMALLAAAGGLLVAVGFGMRRLTRVPDSA